jgi:hypothetical protein
MADMFDCGYHSFMAWSRQDPSPATGVCWYNRWFGDFDPNLPAEKANETNMGMITEAGQHAFMRGWRKAQDEYLSANNRGE